MTFALDPRALTEWRDFYVMIGTASGAIVGANFVVVTLTAGRANRAIGVRGFISPTAVHLGSVLLGSAILTVPSIGALALALLLGLGGLAGMAYGVVVAVRIWKLKLAIEDRLWYALLPIVAYVAILGAAIMIVRRIDSPLHVVAASFVFLLVVGMRNAWDMASFMVMNDLTSETGEQP